MSPARHHAREALCALPRAFALGVVAMAEHLALALAWTAGTPRSAPWRRWLFRWVLARKLRRKSASRNG